MSFYHRPVMSLKPINGWASRSTPEERKIKYVKVIRILILSFYNYFYDILDLRMRPPIHESPIQGTIERERSSPGPRPVLRAEQRLYVRIRSRSVSWPINRARARTVRLLPVRNVGHDSGRWDGRDRNTRGDDLEGNGVCGGGRWGVFVQR